MRFKPVFGLMVIATAWLVAAAPQAFAGRQTKAAIEPQKRVAVSDRQRKNLDVINRRLGNTIALHERHLQLFLLGNLKTGHWMKLVESAPEAALAMGLASLESDDDRFSWPI